MSEMWNGERRGGAILRELRRDAGGTIGGGCPILLELRQEESRRGSLL